MYSSLYRDQYGFLKGSQWITEEKFEEFESYYAPIVKRRHEKWKQLLKEHHQQWPPKSSKRKRITPFYFIFFSNLIQVKRYIRKGIPPDLRGQVMIKKKGVLMPTRICRHGYITVERNPNWNRVEVFMKSSQRQRTSWVPKTNIWTSSNVTCTERFLKTASSRSIHRLRKRMCR